MLKVARTELANLRYCRGKMIPPYVPTIPNFRELAAIAHEMIDGSSAESDDRLENQNGGEGEEKI